MRGDLLAELRVGHPHHGGLRDGRVLVEHLLDLARVHVEPAAQDHVLRAVHDVVVARGIAPGEVAGAEPAVLGDGLGGGLRLAPVALHHVLPADPHLAQGLLIALGHDGPVRRHQLQFAPADGASDRARLMRLTRMVEARDRGGLGQAVALEDLAVEGGLEAAQQLHGQGRSAGDAQAQAGQVLRMVLGRGQHGPVHGGHADEHVHRALPDGLRGHGGIEAGDQRQAGARRHGRHERAREAEDVEQRQAAEHGLPVLELDQRLRRGVRVGAHVPVGQLGALGAAGGAGGVEDDGVVLEVPLDGLGHRAGALREVRGEAVLAEGAQRHTALAGALHGFLGRHGPQHRRARVLQVVLDLAALEQRVHRDDDGAQLQGREEHHRERRDVRHHERHAVPGADALLPHEPGQTLGLVLQLGVRHAVLAEDQGGGVRMLGGGALEAGGQGEGHDGPPGGVGCDGNHSVTPGGARSL